MEIKEGMYVRFTNLNKSCQYIGKLENINECRDPRVKNAVHVNWIDDYVFIGDNDIIKASFNIIDLIEVGDIITYEFPTGLGMLKYQNVAVLPELLNTLKNGENNHEYTILSIVTHEQFNSMKHEVGE